MFLKRAFYSLRHRWKKVLAHILIYSILFSLCFGAIMVYSTVRGQQAFLQGALGRAVTMRGVQHWVHVSKTQAGGISTNPLYEDIQAVLGDEAVEGWNTCKSFAMHIEGCQLLYAEERAKSYEEHRYGQLYFVHEDGMEAVCVLDSERSQAFLTTGYQLIEGSHFSGEDPGDIIMVSEDFAELNQLHIGDKVRVSNIKNDDRYGPFSGELEITGIFRAPDTALLKGTGATPEETVVIPVAVRNRLAGQTMDSMKYTFATFYLKEGADRQAFVQRLRDSLPIRDVIEDYYGTYSTTPPEETVGMDFDEMAAYIEAHPQYDLQLDSQWYGMVAKPLDQEARLAGAVLCLLLGSVALIIALIVALSIKERRREVGILLSMGESRVKVIGQLAVETAFPILLALVVGVGVGTAAGVPLTEGLCNGVYEQSAADTQSTNDSITFGFVLNAYPDLWSLNERDILSTLTSAQQDSLEVFPQAEVQTDPRAMAAYAGILLAAALLALLVQAASILTAKPAKILLNRR